MPDKETRLQILSKLLAGQKYELSEKQLHAIATITEGSIFTLVSTKRVSGYSASDLTALCRDAALGPIRELGSEICDIDIESVRAISQEDFDSSLKTIRASVSSSSISSFESWNKLYGSYSCT